MSRRTQGNLSKLNPTWHGPHEIIDIISPDKVFKIREIGNETHIQQVNIKMIKPYKVSPYTLIMNHVMDNKNVASNNIVKYINNQKLTINLLQKVIMTPSSKGRQI